jgi:hypothetical protein
MSTHGENELDDQERKRRRIMINEDDDDEVGSNPDELMGEQTLSDEEEGEDLMDERWLE